MKLLNNHFIARRQAETCRSE